MQNNTTDIQTKFCKHCGDKIPLDAVICTKCGRQVEELKGSSKENIIINNNNSASSAASASAAVGINAIGRQGTPKNKGTSLLLCALGLIGFAGLHKFYEGKVLMGIIYFCTGGLFFIGTVLDLIALLGKPSTYYV